MFDQEYDRLVLTLASPEHIRQLAERVLPSGEVVGLVTKPYTVHYQTCQPEPEGLFCQKIFGPIRTGYCACGQYENVSHLQSKQCCEECGVEITDAKVRRYNMGYIHLHCPVIHIWYLKSVPSLLARILNQPMSVLESLVYYDV